MENELKILSLEPSSTDSQSIVNEIQKNFDNVNIEIAKNRKEFILKLSRFKPHLVISEYNVPNFDGLTSLSITHEMYPELPFIIVTGSPSEDNGILCIKRGAYDYILKQHLSILPVAIEGALKKYELILENKRAYDELRESERKFRLLAENANDLICNLELYPQRKFSYVSPSLKKILGYEPEEFYSRPELLFEIIHNDDKEIIQQLFDGKIDFNRLINYRCLSKSGIMVWLEQTNVPIYDYKNNLIAIQMVARDITSRQMLENELRESENRFRMVSNLITDYAYMFNVDENLNMTGDWVSDSFIRVFGWTVNEIQAMGGWQKCFYEDDLPAVIEHAKKVLSGHPDKIECRMVTKFGDIRWIGDYAVPIFDNHSNRVIKIFGVAEDITEEKKLLDEVNQRKEFFERLAQSTNAAIFVYQGEHFVYANRATELITGYTNEELLKMKFYELVHPDFREIVKQRELQRQMGLPVPRSYEFKIITKNGEEKWVDFSGIIINWSGKPAGLGTAYDITPLKKAILELEKSNERYRTLLENAPIGIIVEDSNGIILSVNKKYEEITGYKREELLNQNVRVLADSENIPFVDENIQRILNGEILDHIVKSRSKDGSEIYVHLIETKIPISEDQFGVLSFCEDLTDKVKLEQQLIENERKLRTIFETANEGMCIADENDTITKVNQKFCEMTGYSENELIGKNFDDLLVHPEEIKDALLQKEKRSHGHLGNYERRIVRKDGNVIWERVTAAGIFGENNEFLGSFGFFTDITEQKKLQEELKQSEEQFRLIWENSKDGMRLTDENGIVILVNPAYCELFGLKKEDIEGKTLAEIYVADRREEILKKHRKRFLSGNIKTQFESLVTLYDGRKLWLDVSNSFIQIGNKKYLLGIFRDVTERKKLQDELIKSEKQFRMIWEKSNDGMILVDRNGIIRLANPSLCKMFEMKMEELLNNSMEIVFEPAFREKIFETHIERIKTGQFPERFEGEAKLASGKHIYFEASFAEIFATENPLFLAIIRDITERKKLIDDLIRAKEEADEANRLKSGFISLMSHEIRTPLNVILGFTNVLKEIFLNKEEDEDLPKYFDAIEKAGKRLLNTITQILDISRIESGEFELNLKPTELNKKVIDATQQIEVLANQRNIKFNISLDEKNPVLMLDDYCIDGVLINLINNAVKFSFENSKIDIQTEVRDDSVVFRIRDYGIGMSEEYQKHLFQPFSQEEVGYSRPFEGTGLGLALTKKFVELMHGEIKVWSKKEEGTQFEVIFPKNIKS